MSDIDIYMKLSTLPKDLKKEVNDFVDFLKSRSKSKKKRGEISRKAGLAKGLIEMSEDFEDPLEDLKII